VFGLEGRLKEIDRELSMLRPIAWSRHFWDGAVRQFGRHIRPHDLRHSAAWGPFWGGRIFSGIRIGRTLTSGSWNVFSFFAQRPISLFQAASALSILPAIRVFSRTTAPIIINSNANLSASYFQKMTASGVLSLLRRPFRGIGNGRKRRLLTA
jgi:hypothetical protein